MHMRLAFFFNALTIAPCFAQQTLEKENLKIELIKRQSEQRLIKKIRNISASLAAVGIAITILSCTTYNNSPDIILRNLYNNHYGMPKNILTHIIETIIIGLLYTGKYLPLTACTALATYLYNKNNEITIQELQKELDLMQSENSN